jgi:LysR family hca operon transcriptional activator
MTSRRSSQSSKLLPDVSEVAIGLMMGYNKSNTSPLLKSFLLRADELVNCVSQGGAYSNSLKRRDRKPSV